MKHKYPANRKSSGPATEDHRAKLRAVWAERREYKEKYGHWPNDARHNRGGGTYWKGKKLSREHRRKMSEAAIRRIKRGVGTYPGNAKPTYYNGIRMRSQMEAKVGRWLDKVGIDWEYEVVIPLGIHHYMPDFYLPQFGIFWEVKGYFQGDARAKLDRVRALYPESRFVIIDTAMLSFLGIK